MDDMELRGPQLYAALNQLHIINFWLGGYNISLRGLKLLTKDLPKEQEISIADLGCGGGHTLIQKARWCRKHNIKARFMGIDANLSTIEYAREKCKSFPEISFVQADICSEEFLSEKYDILSCNLLLHHFDNQQLDYYIPRWTAQAGIGIIVNDLQRHPLPYILFNIVTRLFGASYMTRHDGLLSIRRGFRRKELGQLLKTEEPSAVRLHWQWAFRYLGIIQTKQ